MQLTVNSSTEACCAEKFALPEDEADAPEEHLTHLGKELSTLDDFKDHVEPPDDDDDDPGGHEADFVRDFHFGGGEIAKNGKKTKQEVMAEVMAKSKLAKVEKRKQTEADENKLAELDAKFAATVRPWCDKQCRVCLWHHAG